MQKWEYLTLIRNIDFHYEKHQPLLGIAGSYNFTWEDENNMGWDERLNYLGEQGWDIVSVFPISLIHGSNETSDTTSVRIILKRPKE